MLRNNRGNAGRGRGTGNRPRQRNQSSGRRGRNFAVTPVVRIAINSVVESFRALPPWAQLQAGHMMVGQYPEAFNAIGSSESQGNQLSRSDRQANIAQQAVVYGPAPANADEGTDQNGGQDGGSRPVPKLRGWDRPGICELDFAKRLKNHPVGYSETQKKLDASLLSSALQAVSRGISAGANERVIASAVASARQSTSSYRRLWPSKKTRKAYAIEHAPKGVLPRVRTVDDEFIAHTRHRPEVVISDDNADKSDDSEEDCNAVFPLSRVRFHDPEGEERAVSKDLVQDFIRGNRANYSALKQKVHLLQGTLALFWIKGISHSGLSWADMDDNSIEVPAYSARSPKRKKRKADADG